MSTARVRHKEGTDQPKGHPFRTVLIVSLVLAALILWQLAPIIHGLHALETLLTRVERPRRIIVGLVKLGYHRLISVVASLIHQVH